MPSTNCFTVSTAVWVFCSWWEKSAPAKRRSADPCWTTLAVKASTVYIIKPSLSDTELISSILDDLGVALPGVTRVVLNINRFCQNSWLWLLGGALISGFLVYLYTKTPKGQVQFHKYMLKPPLFGGIFGLITLSIMLPLYDMISEIR